MAASSPFGSTGFDSSPAKTPLTPTALPNLPMTSPGVADINVDSLIASSKQIELTASDVGGGLQEDV